MLGPNHRRALVVTVTEQTDEAKASPIFAKSKLYILSIFRLVATTR